MKFKWILLALVIWTIDFATTVYLVESGIGYESNRLQAFLQSFGWTFAYIVGLLTIFLCFYGIHYFVFNIPVKFKKGMNKKKIRRNLFLLGIGLFVYGETLTIINNLLIICQN